MTAPRFSLQSLNMQIVDQDANEELTIAEMDNYSPSEEIEEEWEGEATAGPSQEEGEGVDTVQDAESDGQFEVDFEEALREQEQDEGQQVVDDEVASDEELLGTATEEDHNDDERHDEQPAIPVDDNIDNPDDTAVPRPSAQGSEDGQAQPSASALYDPTEPLHGHEPPYSPSDPLIISEQAITDNDGHDGTQDTPATPSTLIEDILHEVAEADAEGDQSQASAESAGDGDTQDAPGNQAPAPVGFDSEDSPASILESPTYVPPPSRMGSLLNSESTGPAGILPSEENAAPNNNTNINNANASAPEITDHNPSGTRSRETTAQPDTPLRGTPADMPATANSRDNALHIYQPQPPVGDEAVIFAAAEQPQKRTISQVFGVDDMHRSSKRVRTVSDRLAEEVGGYLQASPTTQRGYEVPPNTPMPGITITTPNGAHGPRRSDMSVAEPATTAQTGTVDRGAQAQGRTSPAPTANGNTTSKEASRNARVDSLPDYESPELPPPIRSPSLQPSPPAAGRPAPVSPVPLIDDPDVPNQREEYVPPAVRGGARDNPNPNPGNGPPQGQQSGAYVAAHRALRQGQGEASSSSAPSASNSGPRRSTRIANLPNKRPIPDAETDGQQANKRPRIRVINRTPPQQDPIPGQAGDDQDPSIPPPGLGQQASLAWRESMISPRAIVPPPPAAPQPPPPNPRRKPPPPDKPEVPGNLTWKTIESLLPSSTFNQTSWTARAFWTVKEEKELRNSWTEEDESTLIPSSISEISASRYFTRLYNCRLQDLFRYGLKYISPPPDPRGFARDEDFWIQFSRLLPHRMFLGKVELLRYALQMAVWYRVSQPQNQEIGLHVWPFVPPWSHAEPGFIAGHLKELRSAFPVGSAGYEAKTEEITRTAEFMCLTQVENKMGMMELCGVMGDRADGFAEAFHADAPKEVEGWEMYLFCLTHRDLIFLEQCLDVLDERQRKTQEEKAATWQEVHGYRDEGAGPQEEPYVEEHRGYHNPDVEFRLQAPAEGDGGKNVPLEPVTVDEEFYNFFVKLDRDDVFVSAEAAAAYKAEKRMGIIAERREAIIRQKLGQRGEGEKRVLLDVPPFDPDPGYELFKDGSKPQDLPGLMVVQGKFVTPWLAGWLKSWNEKKAAGPGKKAAKRWRSPKGPPMAPGIVPGPWVDDRVVGRLEGVFSLKKGGGEGEAGEGGVGNADEDDEDDDVPVPLDENGIPMLGGGKVVEHDVVYRKRTMRPPVLQPLGGGLWKKMNERRGDVN